MCSGTKTICEACGEEEMEFNDICSAADAPNYGIPHRILGLTEYIEKCSDCRFYEELDEQEALYRREEQIPQAKAVLEYLNGERSTPLVSPMSFSAWVDEWYRKNPSQSSWLDRGLLAELIIYSLEQLEPALDTQTHQENPQFVRPYTTHTIVIRWATVAYTPPPLLGTYSTTPPAHDSLSPGNEVRCLQAYLGSYDRWLKNQQGGFVTTDIANFHADCRAAFEQLRSLFTENQAAEPGKPLSFGQWAVLMVPTRRAKLWVASTFRSKMALELAAYTAYLVSAGWTGAAAAFRLQAAEMLSAY